MEGCEVGRQGKGGRKGGREGRQDFPFMASVKQPTPFIAPLHPSIHPSLPPSRPPSFPPSPQVVAVELPGRNGRIKETPVKDLIQLVGKIVGAMEVGREGGRERGLLFSSSG